MLFFFAGCWPECAPTVAAVKLLWHLFVNNINIVCYTFWFSCCDVLSCSIFSCASDEPGSEGENHLHTRYGVWSDRPPRGHPPKCHTYIRRGAPQAGVMPAAKSEGWRLMKLRSPQPVSTGWPYSAAASRHPPYSSSSLITTVFLVQYLNVSTAALLPSRHIRYCKKTHAMVSVCYLVMLFLFNFILKSCKFCSAMKKLVI